MDGTDWTAIISKLKSASPDALITSTAGGAPNVTLTKQLRARRRQHSLRQPRRRRGHGQEHGRRCRRHLHLRLLHHRHRQPGEQAVPGGAWQKKFGADLKTPNDLSVPQYEGVYLYKPRSRRRGRPMRRTVHRGAAESVASRGRAALIQMNKQRHAPLTMYLGQVQADGSVQADRDASRTSIRASSAPTSDRLTGAGRAAPPRLPHWPFPRGLPWRPAARHRDHGRDPVRRGCRAADHLRRDEDHQLRPRRVPDDRRLRRPGRHPARLEPVAGAALRRAWSGSSLGVADRAPRDAPAVRPPARRHPRHLGARHRHRPADHARLRPRGAVRAEPGERRDRIPRPVVFALSPAPGRDRGGARRRARGAALLHPARA